MFFNINLNIKKVNTLKELLEQQQDSLTAFKNYRRWKKVSHITLKNRVSF